MPTLTFYVSTFAIVSRASALAKRGQLTEQRWGMASQEVFDLFERTGVSISYENLHVFKKLKSPAVILGNHMGTAETFLLASMIVPFASVTFIVKQSLIDYPVFGHVMRSRDPVVVGRQNARDDLKTVLTEGADRLQKGFNLVVFPQKTRTSQFNRDDFNTIGVKLAKAAGVPVIPLALDTRAWSNGKRFKDFGQIKPAYPIRFAFGEPMEIKGTGKSENEAVIAFIEQKLAEWKV